LKRKVLRNRQKDGTAELQGKGALSTKAAIGKHHPAT